MPQLTSSIHEPHLTINPTGTLADHEFDSTDHHLVYDLFRLDKVLEEMTLPAVLDILDVGSERLLSNPVNLSAQVHQTVTTACRHLNSCI